MKKIYDAPFLRRNSKREGHCLVWTGYRNKAGYGRNVRFPEVYAHRVAWRIYHGPIPAGMDVLHLCDNPPCIRKSHLEIGDAKKNLTQAKERGRLNTKYGMSNKHRKLSWNQVVHIREAPESSRVIAEIYGVSQPLVIAIRNFRVWKTER